MESEGKNASAAALERYHTVREKLDTGDLVLFSGRSVFSEIIKKLTGAAWSHVGMVFRLPNRYSINLLWEASGLLNLPDLDTGRPNKGVQLVPLSDRISVYHGRIALRLLEAERTPKMIDELYAFREEMKGRPYEENDIELLKAAYDGPGGMNQEDFSSLFCTELIAEAYQRMGLLGAEKPANEYTPHDFCSDQQDESEFRLLQGSLGPEILIKDV